MSEHDDLSMPPPEEEAPRRAASARLEVRGGPGREAMLREALDPANQSLRDALRLSFRVLQLVMVVLVVVFLFSGLKTIEPGQIGLRLQLGQLEEEALEPGALGPAIPGGGCHRARWPWPILGFGRRFHAFGGDPPGDRFRHRRRFGE